MSMWLSMVRVTPEAFRKIETNPEQIDAIFFEVDDDVLAALGIADDHSAGVDYLSAASGLEAMAEATGEEFDEDGMLDLTVSGELGYDAGYGNAFYLDPAAAKDCRESMISFMDEEMAKVLSEAADQGNYLIGIIS